jgi:hypothetical protein
MFFVSLFRFVFVLTRVTNVYSFPDISNLELLNFLPVLINGLKYEDASTSPTLAFLLERCSDDAIRSRLFWGLVVAGEDALYRSHFHHFLVRFGNSKHVTEKFLREQENLGHFAECLKTFPNETKKITPRVGEKLKNVLEKFDGLKYTEFFFFFFAINFFDLSFRMPFVPAQTVASFDTNGEDKIKIFVSKTRPLAVCYHCRDFYNFFSIIIYDELKFFFSLFLFL